MIYKFRTPALHWQILISLALAIPVGIVFSGFAINLDWIAQIFIRALKMIVIPVVFTSVVLGVSNLGKSNNLGRIATKTLSFYLITTIIAAIIGVFLVNLIQPGKNADLNFTQKVTEIPLSKVSIIDQLIGIIPENFFKELANGNLLPIIVFALFFGYFISKLETQKRDSLVSIFESLFDVFMKFTMFIIKFAPIGVFAIVSNMVANQGGDSDKLISVFKSLGLYTSVVWLGALIHGGIVLPFIVFILTKYNPYKHIKQISAPLLTAFSTSSSSATLPLTIEVSENKTGISNKIAGFVLSLGSTINMNGTAIYEGVSAIFIAQVYGIELTLVQQFLVIITSVLAAIGSAGIPMAGIVMMTVILGVVGLPLEGIGIVLAVQQFCDMIRTTVNVYGDTCAAVVIAKSEGEKLNL